MAGQPLFSGVPSQREAIAEPGEGGRLLPTRAWFYFFQNVFNRTVPTASVLTFAGATVPSGYLVCNGAAVSRNTFSVLFSVIGSAFGSGDGSTTFNVPNIAPSGGTQSMIKT